MLKAFIWKSLFLLDSGSCEEGSYVVLFNEEHKLPYIEMSTLAAFFV